MLSGLQNSSVHTYMWCLDYRPLRKVPPSPEVARTAPWPANFPPIYATGANGVGGRVKETNAMTKQVVGGRRTRYSGRRPSTAT